MSIKYNRIHTASETVADLRTSTVSRTLLPNMATKKHMIIQVECPEGTRSSTRCSVHPIQNKSGVISVHFKGHRMPLAIVNLNALNGDNPRSTATIEFILQPSMVNLQRKATTSPNGLRTSGVENIDAYKSLCLLERQDDGGVHKRQFNNTAFQTVTVIVIHSLQFF